jgi:hypothetical protein
MQVQVEEKYGKRRCDITLKRSSNDSVTNVEGRNSPQASVLNASFDYFQAIDFMIN